MSDTARTVDGSKTALRARGAKCSPMHAAPAARQPAPLLARGAVGLRRRVRPDAFGNALGSSLGQSALSAYRGDRQQEALNTSYGDGDIGRSELRVDGRMPDWEQQRANNDQIANAFGQHNTSFDPADDVHLAAGPGYTGLGNVPAPPRAQEGETFIDTWGRRTVVKDGLMVPLGEIDPVVVTGSRRPSLAAMESMAQAYRESGMSGATGDPSGFDSDRFSEVLGFANSYPALARQIDAYGPLISSGVITPEQARDHLLASPRAFMTLRSDYELPVARDPAVPEMKAWNGVSSDPYAATRQNLEKAFMLPPLSAATSLTAGGLAARWLGSQVALQPATQLGVTDVVKGMAISGSISTGIYGFFQGVENATPAGAAVAFGVGAISSGLVKPALNLAAGFPNYALPFTYGNAVTHASSFAFGFGTLGWLNGPPGMSDFGAATRSGHSWWTTPAYTPPPKP